MPQDSSLSQQPLSVPRIPPRSTPIALPMERERSGAGSGRGARGIQFSDAGIARPESGRDTRSVPFMPIPAIAFVEFKQAIRGSS